MASYTAPVQSLIDELGRLPGIGPKSAQRIAFHLLKAPADDVSRLAGALTEAKAREIYGAEADEAFSESMTSTARPAAARPAAAAAAAS